MKIKLKMIFDHYNDYQTSKNLMDEDFKGNSGNIALQSVGFRDNNQIESRVMNSDDDSSLQQRERLTNLPQDKNQKINYHVIDFQNAEFSNPIYYDEVQSMKHDLMNQPSGYPVSDDYFNHLPTQNVTDQNSTQNVMEQNSTQNVMDQDPTQNVMDQNSTQNVMDQNFSDDSRNEPWNRLISGDSNDNRSSQQIFQYTFDPGNNQINQQYDQPQMELIRQPILYQSNETVSQYQQPVNDNVVQSDQLRQQDAFAINNGNQVIIILNQDLVNSGAPIIINSTNNIRIGNNISILHQSNDGVFHQPVNDAVTRQVNYHDHQPRIQQTQRRLQPIYNQLENRKQNDQQQQKQQQKVQEAKVGRPSTMNCLNNLIRSADSSIRSLDDKNGKLKSFLDRFGKLN